MGTLDSTDQNSSVYNTSIEPASIDTTVDNFGETTQIMSEPDISPNMACRAKRTRDSNRRTVKTDRDSSSDSYKSSRSKKDVFKVPDPPKRNDTDRKIRKLEEQ